MADKTAAPDDNPLFDYMAEIDLTTCDREPIHIPGTIQPHGVLLVLRADDLTISAATANSTELLGIAPKDLLGRSIEEFVTDVVAGLPFNQLLASATIQTRPVYLFTLRAGRLGNIFDAIAHRSGERVLFELEPATDQRELTVSELYRMVQISISQLRDAGGLQELYEICATQIRRITGFDRVMVYRFDSEWNGQVVAEEKREDLEPFLGLHYPASDIPSQARELYRRNLLRFIPDRSYTPVPLDPPADPTSSKPLDMSLSVLRSVSPVHLQYLKNMGVHASMSVSILQDGKLWGLIACHHYSPRYVPYDVRTGCELLAQVMSPHLASAEQRELATYVSRLESVHEALLNRLVGTEDLAKALILGTPNVLDFIQAGGAAVVVDDTVLRVGQTPSEAQILTLSRALQGSKFDEIYATDDATPLLNTRSLAPIAAGVLAVKITRFGLRQLLWFRPEQLRTVHWAGDPAKSVAKGDEPDRLSPRGSFALWKQTIHGRSAPWTDAEQLAAKLFRQGVASLLIRRAEEMVLANKDLRLASVEREKLLDSERSARAEAEKLNRIKDEFVATLSHELRTPLNAILGWSQLIGRTPNLDSDIAEGMDIIERNARVQAQMIEDLLEMSRIISGKLRLDLQDAHLPTIVRAAVDTVRLAAEAKGVRIEQMIDPLQGVQITADPGRLQQVFWNLLSNAVKFTPKNGRVQVVVERIDSHVEVSVGDTGIGIKSDFLPYVFDRFRQADATSSRKYGGLGLGLSIVRNLVELHGGTVRAESRGEGCGSQFIVTLPVRVLSKQQVNAGLHPKSQLASGSPCNSLNLKGVRVLVVDDEPDARSLVERLLLQCKCVVSTAASMREAVELLQRETFDVMISDIGMPEADGYSLIRTLREMEEKSGKPKLPAVALTAYSRSEDRRRALLSGFQSHLAKPVEGDELLALVASLAGRV